MEKYKQLEVYLNFKGFKIVDFQESPFFGDTVLVHSNNLFDLRFISDKLIKSIDIKSFEDDTWYDLALVKALIYKEENLNKITTMDELIQFIEVDFNLISNLFNHINFLKTKETLKFLGQKRAKQMFPGKVK